MEEGGAMGGVLGQRRRCGWEVGVYDNVCGLRERDGYGRKGVMNNKLYKIARSLASLTHSQCTATPLGSLHPSSHVY